MAKVRLIVGDTPSLEVDHLRRTLNSLMFVLENISTQVDAATITATEGFVALGLALNTGADSSVAGINGGSNNYTGTGVELVGVRPMNRHPRWPGNAAGDNLKDMEAADAER